MTARHAAMICPEHNVPLTRSSTRYGDRWACNEPWRTIVCWNGRTSTPADYDTRQARHAAHFVFDELWKSGRWTRSEAYGWLAAKLGMHVKDCHIGFMQIADCSRVMAAVAELERKG